MLRKALVVSFAAHGALLCAVRPFWLPPHEQHALAPAEDRWVGTTAELPFQAQTGAVYDVSVDTPAAPASPPAPAPAPVAAPDPPAQKPAPAPVIAVAKPHPQPLPASGEGRVQGERDSANHPSGPSTSPPRKRGGAGGGVSAGIFGAEGEAGVRSLGRALTRTIPSASASDPLWAALPRGDAGRMEFAVHVDEGGHITSAEPRGSQRPKALVSLLNRTMVFLQAGTFAVRAGTVSEGTEIIELRASILDAASPDNPLIGTDGLGHDKERGKAWFQVPGGSNYVEVSVKVLSVDSR